MYESGCEDQLRAETSKQVAVIILNWKAAEMTLETVASVFAQSRAPDCVYVVENGSGDGSESKLAAALAKYGSRAVLIVNQDNLGFGGGCNAAIGPALAAGHSFVWLLNNDAQPDPTCLSALLAAARGAPRPFGMAGALLVDPTGQSPPHFGSWMHPASLKCGSVSGTDDLLLHRFAWITAASMLLSAEALRSVGGFDERFFMYWEDADLNIRLRRAGFTAVLAPDARVLHHAGTSSAAVPVQRYIWHFVSQRLWLTKHHPTPRIARLWLRSKFLLKAAVDRDLGRFTALLVRLPRQQPQGR